MNAVLSLKIDLLEPARVSSASDLLELDPTQIREILIRLASLTDLGDSGIEAVAANTKSAVEQLVFLAQRTQPEGTAIEIWFQGRSEKIRI